MYIYVCIRIMKKKKNAVLDTGSAEPWRLSNSFRCFAIIKRIKLLSKREIDIGILELLFGRTTCNKLYTVARKQ